MKRYKLLATLASLSTTLFLYAYITFYWQHRACFNEAGRCLDEETGVVYTAQSGITWASLALLSFACTIFFRWRAKHPNTNPE